jgi:cell division protein FtsB
VSEGSAAPPGRRRSARTPGGRGLRRARVGLVVAAGLGGALVITQLPLSELLAQRAALRTVGGQLAVLDQRNAALRAENASVSQPGTVAAIAHGEYGLVRPGQIAYVILPASGHGDPDAASLGTPVLSRSEMVSSSPQALTGIAPAGASGSSGAGASRAAGAGRSGSLLSRMMDRLAFWRWAF